MLGAMELAAQTISGSDRLDRFRLLMARLDPAGDPARALAAGFYVAPTGSASTRIAARLALASTSTHLLVGGVGSGKTTQLLDVKRRLDQLADTCALFIDVTRRHDIDKLMPGVIIVQVGLVLADALASLGEKRGEDAAMTLRTQAHGYNYDPDMSDDDYLVHVPGLLVPPEARLAESVRDASEPVKQLVALLHARWKHIVVLVDGLDRLVDMVAFEQLVENDVRALAALGVGVVLAGPLRSLYGVDRTVTQRFDDFHYQPWIDPSDGEGACFLANVLRRRLPEDALDEQGLEALVQHSGGVLRDLIALAQLSCVEAYMGDSEAIGLYQADSAIDTFGRKHMQGLRPEEIEVMQRVRTKGLFVQTSDDELALLMTRRVLEYRSNGRPRYVVHPTIDPFLREMAGEQR
ncbi:hypothetical protein BE17_47545 [Sorangium cellulosum]|uniref:AAA+ ATPase domain-containing protein n=1 Tax=Sorangium cellulosum TaxID=56 RepID=A0A150SR82_SORCE|nr:hypothetical protein BE17_47545 [Sorangium cellulosum]